MRADDATAIAAAFALEQVRAYPPHIARVREVHRPTATGVRTPVAQVGPFIVSHILWQHDEPSSPQWSEYVCNCTAPNCHHVLAYRAMTNAIATIREVLRNA